MHLIFPVIAACLFSCRPRRLGEFDYIKKRNCCNGYWWHLVAINPEVSINAVAVSDWLRLMTWAKLALRLWVNLWAPGLWPSGLRSRLRSIRRNVTSLIHLGRASRRMSIDMDCRMCSDSLWNPNGGIIFCTGSSVERSRSTLGLREHNRADYSRLQRRLNRR